jgi:nucleoside-diphosphate-sugar epimerase
MVENITGKKANVKEVNGMRPYDAKSWRMADYSARQWGWLPKKTLEDTIREMVNAAS